MNDDDLPPGPAALRGAMLEMCLALAAGFRSTPEKCKAQIAGPLALIRAHDMQVRK